MTTFHRPRMILMRFTTKFSMLKDTSTVKALSVGSILVLLFLSAQINIGCSTEPKPTPSSVENSLANTSSPATEAEPPPLPDTAKKIQVFSFGSCAIQNKPQPIWTTILNHHPDIYLGLGDNVYASSPQDKPIAKAYERQLQFPEFKTFRKQIPMLGVYDDHDYGLNDGGKVNPEKDIAKAEYLKFFPYAKNFIPTNQEGIYHVVTFGQAPERIKFVFLDTRWFRDELEPNPDKQSDIKYLPTKDTTKTFLGSQQWQWLEAQLKTPAELTVIISSIQFLQTQQGFEKWENFPHERQRMIQLLQKNKLKNVIVLSGDRHFGEMAQLKKKNLRLLEVTASSINRASKLNHEKNDLRLGNPYFEENFGLAEVDWKHKKVKLKLINIADQVVAESVVSF